MTRTSCLPAFLAALLSALPATAAAQGSDAVGTRAQGMGGAFVAVADDASAVYWNPGGLAGGAFFSLLLEGNLADAVPDGALDGGRRSGWLLALTTPALGLSYYRLRRTALAPGAGLTAPGTFRLESLVTHHVGATVVQSLADGIAVGTTLKLVRGLAASTLVTGADRRALLDEYDVLARSGSRFDLDVGLMASGALGRAGVTVRNLTEPAFRTGTDDRLRLEREVRAGVAMALLPAWLIAADLDLTRTPGPLGDVRELALGTEGQVLRRLAARAGLRLNTAGDRGRAPALSVGASFAALGSLLVDAHVTAGGDTAFAGWGLGGRMVF